MLRGTGPSQFANSGGFQVDIQDALPVDYVEAIAFTRTNSLKGNVVLLGTRPSVLGSPPQWPGYPEAHIDPFDPLNPRILVRLGVLQGCQLGGSAQQTLQIQGTPGVPLGAHAMLHVFVVDPTKVTNGFCATSAGHELRC